MFVFTLHFRIIVIKVNSLPFLSLQSPLILCLSFICIAMWWRRLPLLYWRTIRYSIGSSTRLHQIVGSSCSRINRSISLINLVPHILIVVAQFSDTIPSAMFIVGILGLVSFLATLINIMLCIICSSCVSG